MIKDVRRLGKAAQYELRVHMDIELGLSRRIRRIMEEKRRRRR